MPDARAMGKPAVRMRSIVKSFGAVDVLKNVDMEIRAGEVHALAGENGAGKSTLMKILQGVYPITSGSIDVQGVPVTIRDPAEAERAGIGMVFQEFSLIPTMTVAQNISLGRERRGLLGLIDDRAADEEASRIFEELGVKLNPKTEVGKLGTAYWQLVEIAKALAKDAKVLIMDEPTASLAGHEVENLFRLIERLKKRGIAIVYISHRMDEIRRVADRITVLRDGRVVLKDRVVNVTIPQVIEAIVGRRLASDLVYRPREQDVAAPVLLDARGIASAHVLQSINVSVRAGEIVGIAGLMGSGRTEFARLLAGLDRCTRGVLRIDGQVSSFSSALAAQRAGIALIPEDRREQGLVLDHSVSDNLVLPVLDRVLTGPLVSPRKVRALAKELVAKYAVKLSDVTQSIRLLSGGNQQKVVVAKWMNTDPRVLVMDEATAGVDIGTKTEILEMVREFASRGNAVVFISSELAELLAVADRIIVLRDGRTDRLLERAEVKNEEQLQLILQGELE